MCRALREASVLSSKSKHQPSRIENAYEITESGVDLAAVYVVDEIGKSRLDVLCLAPLQLWLSHPNEDIELRCQHAQNKRTKIND